MIKFGYTILFVQDVEMSISFYERAFGFQRKFIAPDQSYAELDTGETTLSFASTDQAKSNLKDGFTESNLSNKPFGIEIAFTAENVAETVESALKAGAILIERPQTKPWDQVVAYIRDPNGFLVEICTPMG
jgi:uncharacterized glyoxalase superfamily protein PhnB